MVVIILTRTPINGMKYQPKRYYSIKQYRILKITKKRKFDFNILSFLPSQIGIHSATYPNSLPITIHIFISNSSGVKIIF